MRSYHSLSREASTFRPRSLSPMLELTSHRGERTANAYVLPRLKNVTLNTEQRSSEDTKPSLIHKLNELERQKRLDKQKIEQLEQIISELRSEIDDLRRNNKTLLEESSALGGDVHALYQDLFITDMKQQMQELSKEAADYRMQKEERRIEMEQLRKTNGQHVATIKRYRTMLQQALKRTPTTDHADSSSMFSGVFSESDKSSFGRSFKKKSALEPDPQRKTLLPGLKLNVISLSKIEKMFNMIQEIEKVKNLPGTCKVAVKAVKSLIKCEKLTLFLVDPALCESYARSFKQSSEFIGKFRLGLNWCLIHTHKEASQEEPNFSRLEDLKHPIREHDKLIILTHVNNRPGFVFQCQNKLAKRTKKRLFTQTDELIVKMLGFVTSITAQILLHQRKAESEIEHGLKVFNVANKIVSAKSHKDIANRIRQVIPSYTAFESAGLVFVDPYTSEFFIMIHDPQAQEFYSEGILRFPNTMGITGEAFQKDEALSIDNPKLHGYYNPEIDNVAGCFDVQNIYISPLRDWNGKLVALLQLTNKKGGVIDCKEKLRLEPIVQMIGYSVASANLNIEQASLTIQTRNSMNSLVSAFAETETSKGEMDTSHLLNIMYKVSSEIKGVQRTQKNLSALFR